MILKTPPKPIWYWYVFGKGCGPGFENRHLMFVEIAFEVPLRKRVITRLFLGSVWERAP